jgi:hypothetical protein
MKIEVLNSIRIRIYCFRIRDNLIGVNLFRLIRLGLGFRVRV